MVNAKMVTLKSGRTKKVQELNYINKRGEEKTKEIILDTFKGLAITRDSVSKLTDEKDSKHIFYTFSILGDGVMDMLKACGYDNHRLNNHSELKGGLCPNATEMCKGTCYNNKIFYDGVINSKINNLLLSLQDNFIVLFVETFKKILKKDKKKNDGKKIYVRLHVDGEIYSLNYLTKLVDITRYFPSVNFFTYTKSFDILGRFLKNDSLTDNLNIMLSVYNDISDSDIDKVRAFCQRDFKIFKGRLTERQEERLSKTYKINKEVDKLKVDKKCLMACNKCLYCVYGKQDIEIVLH